MTTLPKTASNHHKMVSSFQTSTWQSLIYRGKRQEYGAVFRSSVTIALRVGGEWRWLVARALSESQNRIGWKRPSRSSSPTVNLTPPRPPLHHVPKHLIPTSFKYLQGWRLNHFPGQPGPMLDNPFREVKFPNIQSKPPLAQLEAISSCPITCYLGKETDPHLSTTSFQLRCPSLDTLQHLNVSLVVGGPKLNTVFEVQPHQCQVQGHDHFPTPAGHTIFDTSQDAIGFLGRLGTLLAHIQPAVDQHPWVLLCQAAFQPLFPKPVALHGVAVAQVQDLALSLVKPHTIDLGPSIQPVQVPLQSLPTLQQINTPTQLGVICKLTEGALDPFVQIIDEDIKQNWPQHRALGNTSCDRLPTGVNSIHHHSLGLAIQPVLYPAKSAPVQAMSSQFLQENAVENREAAPADSGLTAKPKSYHNEDTLLQIRCSQKANAVPSNVPDSVVKDREAKVPI
ncbi:hypothetical protein QYF61_002282 [Mycteria americana]|uniref:Uncharacterized protein n=1 Tax=Mycteria americana TaxID=33587 RepID=A0AAN7NVN3_MYCAM|nr:hypothetical protein QYF61_002282 [Mycteria americana]